MHIYARQGDLVIEKLSSPITRELAPSVGLVLAGSDTSAHRIAGKVESAQDGRDWLIRVTEPTSIDHADRHHSVTLEPGDYVVRPLRERGDDGDRAVDD